MRSVPRRRPSLRSRLLIAVLVASSAGCLNLIVPKPGGPSSIAVRSVVENLPSVGVAAVAPVARGSAADRGGVPLRPPAGLRGGDAPAVAVEGGLHFLHCSICIPPEGRHAIAGTTSNTTSRRQKKASRCCRRHSSVRAGTWRGQWLLCLCRRVSAGAWRSSPGAQCRTQLDGPRCHH